VHGLDGSIKLVAFTHSDAGLFRIVPEVG
jgi:hypothetical protein